MPNSPGLSRWYSCTLHRVVRVFNAGSAECVVCSDQCGSLAPWVSVQLATHSLNHLAVARVRPTSRGSGEGAPCIEILTPSCPLHFANDGQDGQRQVWAQRELRHSGLLCVLRQLRPSLGGESGWRVWSNQDIDAERLWCCAYVLGDLGSVAAPLWASLPYP